MYDITQLNVVLSFRYEAKYICKELTKVQVILKNFKYKYKLQ